jgi:plastocyanin
MRITTLTLIVALSHQLAEQSNRPSTAAVSDAETVTIVMSNFRFEPDHIQLRVGRPIRLHLINEANGGHNFNSPKLFAASSFPPGSSAPIEGTVEIAAHQTADFTLIPQQPGTYQFKCTHTLRGLLGMTGGVEVVP